MDSIDVFIDKKKSGELFFNKEDNLYGFNYSNYETPISLIMPCQKSTYNWRNKLHPIFEMNMPEGYLYELFKKILSKEHGYVDDFLVLSYLAPNIQSRLGFTCRFNKKGFDSVDLEDILHNDNEDTFSMLLKTFLKKNAISGVQPKTLALIKNKSSLTTREYIIKTWGDEFPRLAENEFFCLKAVEDAGVPIPNIMLSENCRFLLVEKFNYDINTDKFLGFEEVLGLLGKNSDEKYSGSYEQIAKVVYSVTTNKEQSMINLYKTIVMGFLLKNGDGHLKNFGVIYNEDFSSVKFAPAYDIVNTVVYMFKDKPALTISGRKMWFGRKELIKFGVKSCFLSLQTSTTCYDQCINSLKNTITKIEHYVEDHNEFITIGSRMIDSFKISLNQQTHKEISDEVIRNWK